MGYPTDILSTRAIIRPGKFAVIPPEGLVNNVIPGIRGCRISIVASPKYGAGFVQYVVTASPGGGTHGKFGAEPDIETFLYVAGGRGVFKVDGREYDAPEGAYVYSPPGVGLEFQNPGPEPMKAVLYKQRYVAAEGVGAPWVCFGNIKDMEYREYDGMANVFIKDLLPADTAFDMNMHVLSFAPGGCHPFIETHVQEHGMYILEGQGVYYLEDQWKMVKKDDYLWLGPYCPQAAYGCGTENFTYIYSKDCNRDAPL